MTWSGDAVWAIEEAEGVGIHLDYEVPMEGVMCGMTDG